MSDRIVEYALGNRFVVLILVLLLVVIGAAAMLRLPVDAVPDVTNIQVQVLTTAPALGPVEVEQFVTFPVEAAMSGLPGVTEIRSVSRFGLSAVTVVFEEGTDIYRARQLVNERLQQARNNIPEGFGEPEMGPIASGLGEIYQFQVRAEPGQDYSLMELRSVLDWDIAFKLRGVPGVIEVNTFGGELKTYEVQVDPNKLVDYGITLNQLFEALERNNTNRGGGYIVHQGEQRVVRGEGLIKNLEDVSNIVVDNREDGTPIYVRDLGMVTFAPMVRQGAVTRDGEGEAVVGIVMMLIGENGRTVVDRVKEKIRQIEPSLPPGVTIDTFYDRTELIRRTIRTVVKNLTEGGVLVILVLLVLLGSLRAGLTVALAIPLSMLGAFVGMLYAGFSGNLMSLGAIDFGLMVDGSVVMIENVVRRVAEHHKEESRPAPLDLIRDACQQVVRPVIFGVSIIIIVYLPILSLRGVEGKMFRPMAFTVIFALLTSLALALTLMPVLASLVLRSGVSEKETFVIRWAKRVYQPLLQRAMAHPGVTILFSGLVFGLSVWIAFGLGAVFIPKLDEGSIALQAWRLPSVSLEQSIESTTKIEKILRQFPEVSTVVSKTGRAEIATDPMGVEISDIFVMLQPHESGSLIEWPLVKLGLVGQSEDKWETFLSPDNLLTVLRAVHGAVTGNERIPPDQEGRLDSLTKEIFQQLQLQDLEFDKDKLIFIMDSTLKEYIPANTFSFSQPIELRMAELIAGVRADVGIGLYGPDLDVLKRKGDEIVRAVNRVPGATEVRAQQIAGLPNVRIRVDRKAIARYGINAADVLSAVEAIGGRVAGQVVEGQPRFALQVRFAPAWRKDLDTIREIKIADPKGRQIPLSQLAELSLEEGPAMVTRDAIQRRLMIEANVRGRDLAGFVADAQAAVNKQVNLPPGYYITWGGQFKNLQEATGRLMIAVPVALFLIFALLYVTFNSLKPAILIYLNVPMAATGGIFALWLRDMPFSISAGVGFIALFGVAVLNGLVLVTYILQRRQEGENLTEAVIQGALIRMRPVLMTALVASLGFIPMAFSTSAGAEVQRPLATVVIGGLVTSTILTLIVLPAIYRWFEPKIKEVEV
ncbi:MAG: efflux RND transporter permease subunit [Pirellulaceae bacterium]